MASREFYNPLDSENDDEEEEKKVREIFLYYKNQHRKHKKNIKSSLINELFLASLNERGDFHRDGINFSHTALLLSYLFPFLL